jgi:hypothetical protein
LTVPQHLNAHGDGLAQAFCRFPGPVLLNEIEGDADENDGADDKETGEIARKRQYATGNEEDDDERIAESRQIL